ncbi:MAG: hydrogenase maturation protease [Candidatus Freyarchaeota archaeon]|nr:hydrogenase maturation protease [Candidatus Jordarchaeia archaeon]MBS7269623.1 hydrogenase maturation protease [Candidatus Jordarchaeia archaeon]MBS7281322.1 hydrogenase maturation protease [Candidatus Jordarchaeia archaeon]
MNSLLVEVYKIRDGKRILIIGVGNLLLGDEGVGVHVVEDLMEMSLPSGVEVVDGGTGGISILNLMEGADKVIIVDAVLGGGAPGEIYVMGMGRLMDGRIKFFSLHELDLLSALRIGKELGKLPPELVLVGVEPKNYEEFSTELSPEVRAAVPKVIKVILELL